MENKMYRTKDLGEAAMLITKKMPLAEMERQGYTCWFVFLDYDLCKDLSNQYFFGDLQLNAREFFEATLRLKNQIFNK